MMNGLITLPTIIGLVLSGVIVRQTRWYLEHDPTLGSIRMSATERAAAGYRG